MWQGGEPSKTRAVSNAFGLEAVDFVREEKKNER
jgi:hypothetical protein